ncbi:MAG: 1-acyl-sn-glycerol-3-phosphate acyltransferase [Bacteroidetes bacterium]|nr:1-acyl-sn-glycerol-3-phosphate acyltransferase [Bacteroidota bacterium]
MKIFKEIFARIWALWSLVLFISTMFIAVIFYLPLMLMPFKKAAQWHRMVSKIWMFVYLNLIGCPIRIKGKEHFKVNENYIIVCNHNSLMDIPITTPFLPQANKTIAKKSFSKVPIFGWIYSWGSVLVDRKNVESRKKSYEAMKKVLKQKVDMLIFPEGSRNKTENPLRPFYDGAFKLAHDTGKKIIPVLLFNTKKILPQNKNFYVMPHEIRMEILPPVNTDDVTFNELKEKVFRIMWDYFEANK